MLFYVSKFKRNTVDFPNLFQKISGKFEIIKNPANAGFFVFILQELFSNNDNVNCCEYFTVKLEFNFVVA